MKLNKFEKALLIIFTFCVIGLVYGFLIGDLILFDIANNIKNFKLK